jgi:hypothetical protein
MADGYKAERSAIEKHAKAIKDIEEKWDDINKYFMDRPGKIDTDTCTVAAWGQGGLIEAYGNISNIYGGHNHGVCGMFSEVSMVLGHVAKTYGDAEAKTQDAVGIQPIPRSKPPAGSSGSLLDLLNPS